VSIEATFAVWALPFVLPICLYVAYTDLSRMKITNRAVVALAVVFLVLGFILLPFDLYVWRIVTLGAVLVAGVFLNAAGAMGAGDAKFIAAAAPFIAPADLRLLFVLFMATLLAAALTHRTIRLTPLRRLAPDWESWNRGRKFPMGLALGPCLVIYLILGALWGAR
jgi:prepilin peptidase CpaA